MAPNKIISWNQTWSTAASAVAVSLAVIGLAYALATPAEQAVLWSNEAVVFAHGSPLARPDANASTQARGSPARSGSALPQPAAVDAPRECAPEIGITDACIFN